MSTPQPKSHLEAETLAALELPLDERIAYARRDFWIGYDRAEDVIRYLEDMLAYPKSLRMPGVLIVADSGNGKSRILERFTSLHPPEILSTGDPAVSILKIMMPSEPSESRFWSALLLAMKVPHRDTDPVQSKESLAYDMLSYCGVKALALDELHNVLNGSARAQKHFLAVLKNLTNQLKLPIIAAGTRDALRALHIDKQLASRFESKGIRRWEPNQKFQQLLQSFELLLPLQKPSQLSTPALARKVFQLGDGTIGSFSATLKDACVAAIRNGSERITSSLLDEIEALRKADEL